MKALIYSLGFLLLFLIVAVCTAIYLAFFTSLPLDLAKAQLNKRGIVLEAVEGGIVNGFSVTNARFSNEAIGFKMGKFRFHLGFNVFSPREFSVEEVILQDLEVEIKPDFYKTWKPQENAGRAKEASDKKQNPVEQKLKEQGGVLRIVKVDMSNLKLIVHPPPLELQIMNPFHLQREVKQFVVDNFTIQNFRTESIEGALITSVEKYLLRSNIISFEINNFQADESGFSWQNDASFAIHPDHIDFVKNTIDLKISGMVQKSQDKLMPTISAELFKQSVTISIDENYVTDVVVDNFTPKEFFNVAFPLEEVSFKSRVVHPKMLLSGSLPLLEASFRLGKVLYQQNSELTNSDQKQLQKLKTRMQAEGKSEPEMNSTISSLSMLMTPKRNVSFMSVNTDNPVNMELNPNWLFLLISHFQNAPQSNSQTGRGLASDGLTISTEQDRKNGEWSIKIENPGTMFNVQTSDRNATAKEQLAQLLYGSEVDSLSDDTKARLREAQIYFTINDSK